MFFKLFPICALVTFILSGIPAGAYPAAMNGVAKRDDDSVFTQRGNDINKRDSQTLAKRDAFR